MSDHVRCEFPESVKREALRRAGKRCQRCGARVIRGPGMRFNHFNPDWFGGAPTLDNCEVLCLRCDRKQTYTRDIPAIAKSRRIRRREAGIRKDRKITRWRRFNGEIVIAPRQR